jgi:hypothetical protein
MLDMVGWMFVTMYLGSILALALRRARQAGALKGAVGVLLLWTAVEIGIGVKGSHLPVPFNLLMFAFTILLLAAIWLSAPAVRRVAAGTGFQSLIGMNAWRLGGFLFLLLYAADRLPFPFAPVAAVGDMITAVLAIGLLAKFRSGSAPNANLITAWNAFGILDLVVAVSLALLAVPGTPFQLFTQVPARSAFTELPWILVPAAIVPFLFFNHLAIFLRLRSEREQLPIWRADEART